jgi:hypothetical protein
MAEIIVTENVCPDKKDLPASRQGAEENDN